MSSWLSPGSRLLLLLCILVAGVPLLPAGAAEFTASALLARCQTAGHAYVISPTPELMRHTDGQAAGQVLLFDPVGMGQPLTITLPVPVSGYYRVSGTHVNGSYRQGRFGYYAVTADGVALPGHTGYGWYSTSIPPAYWPPARTYLANITWGVVYLEAPAVRLTFTSVDCGLFGTERLALTPVAPGRLTPEEAARRVPAPTPLAAPLEDTAAPCCTVRDLGPLSWVLPVAQRAVTLDGTLAEWDFSHPAITATAATIDKLGWKSPAPEGDADLSARVQFAWDAENLYLAAHVTDDQLAETAGQAAWGSPWGHDTVVARILPPNWLTGGPRATGPVASDQYFGLSYYSPETGPRPLPGGARYLATRAPQGYDIEAAIPFRTLGFRPEAGDRLPGMIILSDIDPQKAPGQRFDQYGLPTRGFGDRQVAQLRLLNSDGWGADFFLSRTALTAGSSVRFLGYVDVVTNPLNISGVELISRETGQTILRQAATKTLTPGHRYEVSGILRLPADVPPGKYDVRLAVAP
ncbi:MAG TPA: sugar-binding protein [Armatimonadota bacterium]|jgi:hypothetical protein